MTRSHDIPQFASAFVTQPNMHADLDPQRAILQISDTITAALGPEPIDLLLWFASGSVANHTEQIAATISERLNPRVQLGCTAIAVLHDEREYENASALSALAARLPGATLTPFHLQAQNISDWAALIADADMFIEAIGAPKNPRLFVLLADPATAPLDMGGEISISILRALNDYFPGVPAVGGVASNGMHPNANCLLLNNVTTHTGVIGIAISGDIDIEVITSQGCRPVGPIFTVTAAHENLIDSLDGEKPLALLQQVVENLSVNDRRLLHSGGLYVGRAVRRLADSDGAPGRGDFLVRGVLGIDSRTDALMIADVADPGDMLQFHVRDAATAVEDLELCLAPQAFSQPPSGALLFTCNGRGTHLFGRPHADTSTIQQMLATDDAIPLAGFFCAGEIAPIGARNFLHTHTASVVLFRATTPQTL